MCACVMDHLRELSELPPAHNPHPYKSYKDAITLAATGRSLGFRAKEANFRLQSHSSTPSLSDGDPTPVLSCEKWLPDAPRFLGPKMS